MIITICGGGGLGHTCAGVLSNRQGVMVNMLTNHPERWNHSFNINAPEGVTLEGKLEAISSNPKDLIPQSDIVLLCLPSFLVEKTILEIKPYLSEKTVLGTVVAYSGFLSSVARTECYGLWFIKSLPKLSLFQILNFFS